MSGSGGLAPEVRELLDEGGGLSLGEGLGLLAEGPKAEALDLLPVEALGLADLPDRIKLAGGRPVTARGGLPAVECASSCIANPPRA